MLLTYFTVALRNLRRQWLYTTINIFGLMLGIASCLLIIYYVQFEHSWDSFHTKADRTYMVYSLELEEEPATEAGYALNRANPAVDPTAWLEFPLGPHIQENVAGVEAVTRVSGRTQSVRYEGDSYNMEVTFVDTPFLSMFDFLAVAGHPEAALQHMDNIVMSQSAAERLLGKQPQIGTTVTISLAEGPRDFTLAGIVADPPPNSTFVFDVLARFEHRDYYEQIKDRWDASGTTVFVQLPAQHSATEVAQAINAATRNEWERGQRSIRANLSISDSTLAVQAYALMPIGGMHLAPDLGYYGSTEPENAFYLLAIAAGILLMACVNYLTLTLSRIMSRALEVGVRKALGARRGDVFKQLWLQAFVIAFAAGLLSLLAAELLMPTFNNLAARQLPARPLSDPIAYLMVFGLAIFISLVAGGIPALLQAGFKPVDILRTRMNYKVRPVVIRGLVLVQFALSLFLISTTLGMYRQIDYMLGKDLGYAADQLVYLESGESRFSDNGARVIENLRTELAQNPAIEAVAITDIAPSLGRSAWNITLEDGKEIGTILYYADHEYIRALDLQLLAGRNFIEGSSADSSQKIIVNETFISEHGIEDPLNYRITVSADFDLEIIGVVKDYHFRSLMEEMQPVMLYMDPEIGQGSAALIRVQAGQLLEAMPAIEAAFKKVAPVNPYNPRFMDDIVANQYEEYERWSSILTAGTLMAIIIAALGLFGLSGVNAQNRLKELGIRKILGASISSLVLKLNRDALFLLGLGMLLAVPASIYVLQSWLENFAFALSISAWIFIGALGLGVALTSLAVSYHSYRAATTNPADVLRDE